MSVLLINEIRYLLLYLHRIFVCRTMTKNSGLSFVLICNKLDVCTHHFETLRVFVLTLFQNHPSRPSPFSSVTFLRILLHSFCFYRQRNPPIQASTSNTIRYNELYSRYIRKCIFNTLFTVSYLNVLSTS